MGIRPLWIGRDRYVPRLLAVACLTMACGSAPDQQRTRAETSAISQSLTQSVVIPGYFSSISDPTSWNRLVDAACNAQPGLPRLEGKVIVSYGSHGGPEDGGLNAITPQYINDIRQLQGCGIQVLGYVDTATQHVRDAFSDATPPRSLTDIANDMKKWMVGYGIDGFFFDDAWRQGPDLTTDQLQAMEGEIDFAHELGGIPSLFNWGDPYPEMRQYVDCGIAHQWARVGDVIYVNYETDYGTFVTYWDDAWNWVSNYMPTRFVEIVNHDTTNESFDDQSYLWALGREGNAAGMYVTNGANYNSLADDALLNGARQLTGSYSDYWGQDFDTVATDASACPPAATLTPTN